MSEKRELRRKYDRVFRDDAAASFAGISAGGLPLLPGEPVAFIELLDRKWS
jgi:hypothetical protein